MMKSFVFLSIFVVLIGCFSSRAVLELPVKFSAQDWIYLYISKDSTYLLHNQSWSEIEKFHSNGVVSVGPNDTVWFIPVIRDLNLPVKRVGSIPNENKSTSLSLELTREFSGENFNPIGTICDLYISADSLRWMKLSPADSVFVLSDSTEVSGSLFFKAVYYSNLLAGIGERTSVSKKQLILPGNRNQFLIDFDLKLITYKNTPVLKGVLKKNRLVMFSEDTLFNRVFVKGEYYKLTR